ncbi:MAG: hypothetical protein ACXVBE_13340, partial [Bdellovibrionota bacterium]
MPEAKSIGLMTGAHTCDKITDMEVSSLAPILAQLSQLYCLPNLHAMPFNRTGYINDNQLIAIADD